MFDVPKMRLSVKAAVGLALAGLMPFLLAACSDAEGQVYDFGIRLYQGQDLVGGEEIRLSDLRGQPIVLNFWAGLCPPCRAEMPEFQEFADEYADRVLVIGVDLGQFFALGTQEDAVNLLNELGVSYPTGYADDPNVVRELEVLGLPATYFITADGRLHRKWVSILSRAKLTEITEEMLSGS